MGESLGKLVDLVDFGTEGANLEFRNVMGHRLRRFS